jgi:anthranilate synthase component 1
MKLRTYEKILSGDLETPISMFSKYANKKIGFLLESKGEAEGRYSFMAADPYITLKIYKGKVTVTKGGNTSVCDLAPIKAIEFYMQEDEVKNTTDLPFAGGSVGTFGYDMIRYSETLPDNNPDTIETPDSHLLFVKEFMAYDHFHQKIHLICLDEETDEGQARATLRLNKMAAYLNLEHNLKTATENIDVEFKSNETKESFMAKVNKAKDYIYNGDIFQVVLSQRFSGTKENLDAFSLYRTLRQVNPSPYMYYFNMGDYEIVGSSPERLVNLENEKMQTCPIAGTRKIGATEEENLALEKELANDEKERAEHVMLVDLGRNDMGRVSQIGSVNVTQFMRVKRYSHVMHLESLVTGMRKEGKSMYDVLLSFLPAGTLSGAPKVRAMEIIDELETVRRGIYGGAIGYFGFNQNMDMCIAIRTMVIKNNTINIQAGAGIVADSNPESEFEECRNKAQALVTAITGK